MAGTNPGFDAATFNAGIRLALKMSAPVVASERATFLFPQTTVVEDSADNVPWDPYTQAVKTGKAPVVVDCLVEYVDAADQDTRLGGVRPTHVRVSMLEADYRKVKGCEAVTYAGERFEYRATDTIALFDAGWWSLSFVRSDV